MKSRYNVFSCILVDDEADALDVLESLLRSTERCEILCKTAQPLKLSQLIVEHQPDVVFVDIKMPDINGLDLLKLVQPLNKDVKFVFVSGAKSYVREAFRASAYDYLYKPIDRNELDAVISRIIADQPNTKIHQGKIRIPVKGETVYINCSELLMLEAYGSYTKIHASYGDEYISSYNLGHFQEKLNPDTFKRIGRNAIINKIHLHKLDTKKKIVTLRSGNVERSVKGTAICKSELE